MASNSDLVLNVGSITSIGMEDINGTSAEPRQRPGSVVILVDAYGYKVFKYVRVHQSGGMTMGQLASRPANVAISNITSGTTTSLVTTGLTADVHEGKLLYVLDNDDSAGAAPEGQVSIIASNSATAVTVEADYPYGTALAANDDLTIISNWQAEDSADGDFATYVQGVVVGRDGITDAQYGWVQCEGFVVANTDTDAHTNEDTLVADVAALGDDATDGVELWVAIALAAATADQVAQTLPVNMKVFSTTLGTGTP